MRQFTRYSLASATAALLALGLAACGGNDSLPAKANISKVYVMGDSLADVGTFGVKFTVTDSEAPQNSQIWPQLVANHYGIDGTKQCNFFAFNGTTFAANPTAGCTNYAIGGGRVQVSAATGGAANPQTVATQMATKLAVTGNYASTDLLLVVAGGNDAADLVGAYLGAGSGAAGLGAYQSFLLQQLDAATLGALLPKPNTGPAEAAGAYMVKLADTFYAQLKTQALDKGALRVAVLNMPDITLTPRFQMVLGGVTQQAGAPAAQALQGAIRQWIGAFNAKLKANINGDSRVALVDFYADFTDEVNNPAAYALGNAKDAVCPITGLGADGLPEYSFATCTAQNLDKLPGKTPGWWKAFAFSDGFHPTPYGHSLLSSSVSRALARAGWL